MSQNDILKRTLTYNPRSLRQQPPYSALLCHNDPAPAPELKRRMSTVDGLAPQSHGDPGPYNHIFRIPIRTKQAPKLHIIQLRVHPDWTPSGDTTTIEVHQSKVLLSNDPVAGEDNVTLDYDVADLRDARGRSKKSHESGMSVSVRNESFEPGSVPTTSLALRINFASATSLLNIPNLVSVAIIIFLFLSPYIGHPAWILPIISPSPANFTIPLTEDISHIHTTFRETVVPFKSRWEFDDNLKVPPSSLFRVLYDELNDIEMGLDSWRKASLPGPDSELHDQIRKLGCSNPIKGPSDPWTQFSMACTRVLGSTVRDSAARIHNASTQVEKIRMMSIYWYRLGSHNHNLIMKLDTMEACMQGLRPTEELLVQIRQKLLAQQDHPNYAIHEKDGWMPELLETVNYTLLHVVPQVKLFDDMIPPAVAKLKKLNQTISRQYDIWSQQKPIVYKGITYKPKPWFPLVIGRTNVEEIWSGVTPDDLELMDDEGILGMAAQRSILQDRDDDIQNREKGRLRPRRWFTVRNHPRVKKERSGWFNWSA